MGFMPNVLDLANTALLTVKDKTYALFERDYPYEIGFDDKQINTYNKLNIKEIDSFSAHSKYNGSHVHTIDYNVVLKRVRYMILNDDFREPEMTDIQVNYIPLIHDFYIIKNGILITDSPFCWDFSKRLPVVLDKYKPTYFHVLKNTIHTTYFYKDPFYIFHYADVREHTNGTIDIYAPCYDTIDFDGLDISGKYRKIVINTRDLGSEVIVYKNRELENMNLDFPVKYNEYVILREIRDKSITGFVVCKDLKIIKRVYLPENRFFCGEPCIFDKSGYPFIIGIAYDNNQMGYACVLNIFTDEYIEYPLNTTVTIGFHSTLHK
jgi:hypothetical protein